MIDRSYPKNIPPEQTQTESQLNQPRQQIDALPIVEKSSSVSLPITFSISCYAYQTLWSELIGQPPPEHKQSEYNLHNLSQVPNLT